MKVDMPECKLSNEELLSVTEELVNGLQEAIDEVKRDLAIYVDFETLINRLNPPPPIPNQIPDDNKVLDDETLDDDYDETLDDDYDDEYADDDDYDDLVDDDVMLDDDDDDAEVAKKLDAEVAKKVDAEMAEELDYMVLDDDDEVLDKFVELRDKRQVPQKDEMVRITKLLDFLMTPVAGEPQFYCHWYEHVDDVVSIIERYGNKARKTLETFYMKKFNRGPRIPIPYFDYQDIVKKYKQKFQQHHLLLKRAKQGEAQQQQQN